MWKKTLDARTCCNAASENLILGGSTRLSSFLMHLDTQSALCKSYQEPGLAALEISDARRSAQSFSDQGAWPCPPGRASPHKQRTCPGCCRAKARSSGPRPPHSSSDQSRTVAAPQKPHFRVLICMHFGVQILRNISSLRQIGAKIFGEGSLDHNTPIRLDSINKAHQR